MNKILRQVKGHRLLADGRLDTIKRMAQDQRVQITKISKDLRKRWKKKPIKKKSGGSKKAKSTANN